MKMKTKKIKDGNMEQWRMALEKSIKQYKPRLLSRFGEVFENILLFIIVCLAIIFRPLNLLIGGIIAIVIILLII